MAFKRERRCRELSTIEAAWIGGLFEGEGCITPHQVRNGRTTWELSLSSTDVETISTLLRVTGTGTITYKTVESMAIATKPQLRWTINGANDIKALLPQIIPFLLSKRERAYEAMA